MNNSCILFKNLRPVHNAHAIAVPTDIKALFTNVPIDEALEVIHQNLIKDETLGDHTALNPKQISFLLKLCLETTHFSFRGEIYQQTAGEASGS